MGLKIVEHVLFYLKDRIRKTKKQNLNMAKKIVPNLFPNNSIKIKYEYYRLRMLSQAPKLETKYFLQFSL